MPVTGPWLFDFHALFGWVAGKPRAFPPPSVESLGLQYTAHLLVCACLPGWCLVSGEGPTHLDAVCPLVGPGSSVATRELTEN